MLLFWLGTIEFETPWGRFILTADSAIRLPKRRRATKEEAAQIWPALEAQLMYASYNELLPWYELYWELTSERLYGYGYGPGGEPRVSDLLRTIEFALWSEQLHLEVQEPYDPPLELDDWEPPPVEKLRKYIPPQSPSEVWGRRDSAPETFIGIRLKDQNGDPVIGSRVRVKLPDGKTKEGKTDSDGELQITGFTVDGPADITLLDFAKPGAAKPIEPDPPKEFKIVVVDETGNNGVADVAMVFDDGATPETVKTDSSGTATYETQSDVVSVNFESRDSLANAIKPMWKSRPPTKPEDYAKPGGDVSAVELRPATIDVAESKGDLFKGLTLEPDAPQTISVRPPAKRAVVIEMHDTLFRNDSAVVNPEGEAPSKVVGQHEAITTVGLIATILRYNEEHPDKKMFIAGHTDRAGEPGDNDKLSQHRAKAVWALVEGKKDEFVEACIAKHSEVDVTQLMDWTNKQYNFTCKPTTLTANPSDENYYRFRTSYNKWVKGPLDKDEKGPRGTKINDTGRLQPPDIWKAMFDLYEHNLRQELGEDENGVNDLRGKLVWVDDGKKYLGYGEKHPTAKNTPDGSRVDADRRVEVMLFDDGEEPDLAGNNGEEIFDPSVYKREHVPPMVENDQELRLLGFDLMPVAAGTPCKITVGRRLSACVADGNGIVKFKTATQPEHCHAVWEMPNSTGTGVVAAERVGVSLRASTSNDSEARLLNLGYDYEDLAERVKAFQREFQRDPTGLESDIATDVASWHDAGVIPALGAAPSATRGASTVAASQHFTARGGSSGTANTTAAPVVGIEEFPGSPSVHWPPNTTTAKTKGSTTRRTRPGGPVYYMEVLRGSHSAITFRGAPNLVIRPNNTKNAVSDEADVWIDPAPNSDKRTIYFWAHRYPQDLPPNSPANIDHTSMFELTDSTGAKRCPFQVKVRFYGRNYEGNPSEKRDRALHHVAMQLYGKTFAVQSDEQGLRLYGGFKGHQLLVKASTNPAVTMAPAQIMQEINSYLKAKGIAQLDHLVLHAHGGRDSNECYFFLGHDAVRFPNAASKPKQWQKGDVNIGFSRHNVNIWNNIHGRVRYIWIMGCTLGSDVQLCSAIARNSGAWVTATMGFTGFRPDGLGANQIEYLWDNALVHYDPSLPEAEVPNLEVTMQDWTKLLPPQEAFLRRARRGHTGKLEGDLDFNIVDLIEAQIGNVPP